MRKAGKREARNKRGLVTASWPLKNTVYTGVSRNIGHYKTIHQHTDNVFYILKMIGDKQGCSAA